MEVFRVWMVMIVSYIFSPKIAKTLDFAENAGFKLVGPLESVNSQVLRGMRYTSARYERLLQQAIVFLSAKNK